MSTTTQGSFDRSGIGPQYAADPPFRKQMRRHQSWYRSVVLEADFGTGPRSSSTTYLGNMLDVTAETSGTNFLTPEIFEVARRRIEAGGGVEPFRCLRNMLSSQPMCFNLFGPLVHDLDLATRLIGCLVDDVARVVEVRIEFAPSPRRDYLGDATSFDAFVAYATPSGEAAFLGIETKLTEPFSTKAYSKPSYVALTERSDSVWRDEAWSTLSKSSTNQLWRNHLLVEALRRHRDRPFGGLGRSVVVRHPLDTECAAAVDRYRKTLVDPSASFLDWPLDLVVARWRREARSAQEESWLDAFALRYLELEASRDDGRGAAEPTR